MPHSGYGSGLSSEGYEVTTPETWVDASDLKLGQLTMRRDFSQRRRLELGSLR